MLNIVYMKMCKQNEYWEKQVGDYTVIFDQFSHKFKHIYNYDFSCNCKAYKYGKKYCKHINQVKDERCHWHQQFDAGEIVDNKCPVCGGELITVKVGV